MASMFTATSNLKKSFAIINGLDSVRFPLLLTKIIQKVHLKDENTFTDEEEEKLQTALSIDSPANLKLVIETCQFIFHQAAYHLARPTILADQLRLLELEVDKVSAVVDVWAAGGKEVITKLRQQTIAPNQLSSVDWSLNLAMSQSSISSASFVQPKAILSLQTTANESTEDKKCEKNKIVMEFNHQELFNLFNQLEMIQSQLDALS